jgi:hypothetical protein
MKHPLQELAQLSKELQERVTPKLERRSPSPAQQDIGFNPTVSLILVYEHVILKPFAEAFLCAGCTQQDTEAEPVESSHVAHVSPVSPASHVSVSWGTSSERSERSRSRTRQAGV